MAAVPVWLAENLRRLRERRGLTQQQAAELAGVPRPTWATLESGTANPTLQVLVRAAAALQVSIERLIAPPPSASRVYSAGALRTRARPEGVAVTDLLPEAPRGVRLSRVELDAQASLPSPGHAEGWREWLFCERGAVEVLGGSEEFRVTAGEVLLFRSAERVHVQAGGGGAVLFRLQSIAPGDATEGLDP